MAKRNGFSPTALMLTLFVFLFPVLMCGFDKKAIVFASLFASLLVLGYESVKKGIVVITTPFLLLFLVSIYSFISLFYVTDKGSQFALSSFFLLCTIMTVISSLTKWDMKEEQFKNTGAELVHKGATVFSVCVIFWQIFIDSKFISKLNLGGGAQSATGLILLSGLCAWVYMARKGRRGVAFLVSALFLVYGFVMSRSLLCYLMAGILLLVTSLNMRHKKMEALMALTFSVILGAVNIAYAILRFATGNVEYKGAITGIGKIIGVGSGGYDAIMAVLDSSATLTPNTFLYLTEAFGIIGIIICIVGIFAGFVFWKNKKTFSSLFAFLTIIVILLSDVNTFFVILPLLLAYYGASLPLKGVKIQKFMGFIPVVLAFFYALLVFSRIPFSMGENAYETGNFEKGEEYFTLSARLSLFDSEGWEKAYECVLAQSESGVKNTSAQMKYLERAWQFNKKNYNYSKLHAEACTREGNYEGSLTAWEYIIANCDNEYLYPQYAQKIMDVMANSSDTVRIEELYNRIAYYADKAVDSDIKFEINNILAKSQSYYIESRENGEILGDMYQDDTYLSEEN
ncbi:MAG: hypothetical protein ACI3XA_08260 [Clostridia bacterium]